MILYAVVVLVHFLWALHVKVNKKADLSFKSSWGTFDSQFAILTGLLILNGWPLIALAGFSDPGFFSLASESDGSKKDQIIVTSLVTVALIQQFGHALFEASFIKTSPQRRMFFVNHLILLVLLGSTLWSIVIGD